MPERNMEKHMLSKKQWQMAKHIILAGLVMCPGSTGITGNDRPLNRKDVLFGGTDQECLQTY